MIDSEVGIILRDADARALNLLREKQHELQTLTDALLEKEELNENEITALIGPSIHARKAEAAKAAQETEAAPVSIDVQS